MKGFRYLVDSKSTRICESFAAKKGIPIERAMELFFASATYRALNDPETGLYLEVYEFVNDMFIEEMAETSQ